MYSIVSQHSSLFEGWEIKYTHAYACQVILQCDLQVLQHSLSISSTATIQGAADLIKAGCGLGQVLCSLQDTVQASGCQAGEGIVFNLQVPTQSNAKCKALSIWAKA